MAAFLGSIPSCVKGITNIAILEGRHLGYGGSGRNGGQVMVWVMISIQLKYVGPEGLETIFKLSNMGAGIMRDRIAKYDIDADFCRGYAYLGSNKRQEKTLRSWLKISSLSILRKKLNFTVVQS